MISTIIINYNTGTTIEKCLQSIQNSEYSIQHSEVIVVDNASTDDSVEKIENLKSKIKNLKLIKNETNLGFAAGNNIGADAAKGEFFFFLNPDTEAKKGSLDNFLRFIKFHPNSIVGPKLLNPNGSLQGSCYNLPTIGRAIAEFWLGQKGAYEKFAPAKNEPVQVEAVVGAAMFMSREIFEKIGGFDKRYFLYFEDLDFCRRAKKLGIKIFWYPGMKIIHYLGISAVNQTKAYQELVRSSKIYHGKLFHYLITTVISLGVKILGRNANFKR